MHNLAPTITPPKSRRKIFSKKIIVAIGTLILVIGATVLFRTNALLNSITGENKDVFQTVRGLFAKEQPLDNTDGRTNIAVLGIRGKNDPNGGLLADSIMIISLYEPTQEVALISIPRDTRAEIPGQSGYRKLNALNALGENRDMIQGLKLTKRALEEITGLDIHYGITVDFAGFKGIISALGGITVDAAEDFYDPNYEGGISVKKGLNEMDAERAHKYVWARLTTNDFDRSRRQREVINAMKDKAVSSGALKNPMFLVNTLNTLGDDNLKTTMSVSEMGVFLQEIRKYNLDEMIEVGYDTSPNGPLTSTNDPVAGYLIVPRSGDWSELQADIQGIFDNSDEIIE